MSPAIVGSGDYTYRAVENWAKWPDGWKLDDVAAVGVDRNDNVYAFHRGDHPMVVFDRDGNCLRTWGEGIFKRAHGVHMGPDDTIYLTDDGDHTVRKCTLDGKVLLTIGIPGRAGAVHERRAVSPVHAHGAVAERRDLRLRRLRQRARSQVHAGRQARDLLGRAGLRARGSSTCRTTSRAMPTAGCTSPTARTIASRCSTATASSRRSGTTCTGRAGCTCRPASARSATSARSARTTRSIAARPNLGPRVSILSNEGKLLARIDRGPAAGLGPGQFISPHGLAVDSRGDLYVGEVSYTAWPSLFPDQPKPARIRALRKFEKVAASG